MNIYASIYLYNWRESWFIICLVTLLYPRRQSFCFILPVKSYTFSKVIFSIGKSSLCRLNKIYCLKDFNLSFPYLPFNLISNKIKIKVVISPTHPV